MNIDATELGRSLAVHQERLKMPTLTKEDAMALAGRDSSSAWYLFTKKYGIKLLSGGRVRRKDLEEALRKEANGL
jgi:hypothetical protein